MKTWKERINGDYSCIRGTHHQIYDGITPEQADIELGYGERLGLNSVRFWIEENDWYRDPKATEERALCYTRLCAKHGMTVMPVFSCGNTIRNYESLTEEQWEKKRQYISAMIHVLKPEPNLLMWDVYNEPFCNEYLKDSPQDEYDARYRKIEADLRRECLLVRELDEDTPITVGHELVSHVPSTLDLVDVISFHDYLTTRKEIRSAYETAMRYSEETGGKPVLNTETGCLGRANPYDVELEIASEFGVGWYMYHLVIRGFWGALHGVVYPDGTVRDPAVAAALLGFFRKREGERIRTLGNREDYAVRAVNRVKAALKPDRESLYTRRFAPIGEILEAAEMCINILEACESVPMDEPPSVKLLAYRALPAEKQDREEICRFAYDMAKLLQEQYCIL